ncbi:helix-turn-helix domain-containing protein [Halomonas aquamarina]|uniref:Helix-turn-helix domain-containing protein n=1 Tax=Vreelandella aquamarina TaxID=77097 RepID=A0ACC5VTD8_9GAMM|nr:RodZ family helix-turn-helix domain-containing protein [Halomonas aquamarina]MBZ5487140.1 helix-turn-helix domain-containing protein [Halomonas aquamarina]
MSDTPLQDSATVSRTHASPGELLSRQREQLGVPLSDAARALNLRPAVVEGLEQDRYDEIPVTTYRRGYLRAYAKYLGMDDRLILDAYQERYGAADAERKVTPVTVNRPPSKLGAWLFRLVTVLVIAALIGLTVMWWQSRGGSEPPRFDGGSMEEEGELPPAAEQGAEPEPPTSPALSTEQPAAPQGDAAAGGTDDPAPVEDTASDEPAATVNDVAALDVAANAEDADTDEEASQTTDAPTGSANHLELTFNEQSWTEIFDANNQRVFVGLQTPGTTATVEGEPPFRLTVGNATGVELRYQGEQVNLVQRAGANNVARFTLGE